MNSWKAIATSVAQYLRGSGLSVSRGTAFVQFSGDGEKILVVFGHEGGAEEDCPASVIESVRSQLRVVGAEELGFGTSEDGRAWALVVQTENRVGLLTALCEFSSE
jgi:hypothetical protein